VVKNPPANAGDTGLIPGSGTSPRGGNATYSSVLAWRNPMDRGAWLATVHGVAKSRTRLRGHTYAVGENVNWQQPLWRRGWRFL